MSSYFVALLLLSAAAFIHSRAEDPELRPASPMTDAIWRIMSHACLMAWVALIVWGALKLHWSQPVSGVIGSLGVNALIMRLRPLPIFPGISMLFAASGVAAATRAVFG
jgi:hypothetical protein